MPRYEDSQSPDVLDELYRRGDVATKNIRELQRRKHLGVWNNVTLLNSYANPPPPMQAVQYRLVFNDTLEFRGHIDATVAASGTVAFILDRPYWPKYDISFVTDMWDGVSSYIIARVSIRSTNGQVSIYWPAA